MAGALVGTIAWFWTVARICVEELNLSEEVERAVFECLLPGLYWQQARRRGRTAEQLQDKEVLAEELLKEAWEEGGVLSRLTAEDQERVKRVANEVVGLFAGWSSCVEGRNGRLALFHHGQTRLCAGRLKALTVIHNYVTMRADGTTAAERFFGKKPRDVFAGCWNDCPIYHDQLPNDPKRQLQAPLRPDRGGQNDEHSLRLDPATGGNKPTPGNDQQQAHDFADVLRGLGEAVRLASTTGEFSAREGTVQEAGGSAGDIESLTEAIRRNTKDPLSYCHRGRAYLQIGDIVGALEDLNEAIRLDPAAGGAYRTRGEARTEAGDFPGAVKDFSQAIHLNRNDGWAYGLRAAVSILTGDDAGAIRDLTEAINFYRTDALAFRLRGYALNEIGDPLRAIQDLREAIHLNELDAVAYRLLGYAYNRIGEPALAIKPLTQAISLNRSDALAFANGVRLTPGRAIFKVLSETWLKQSAWSKYPAQHIVSARSKIFQAIYTSFRQSNWFWSASMSPTLISGTQFGSHLELFRALKMQILTGCGTEQRRQEFR